MRRLLLPAVLLCLMLPAHADYWPQNDPRSGGMRDLMLLYIDDGSSERTRFTLADLLPHVAFLDKQEDGRPLDWFFDSYLFLQHCSQRPDKTWAEYAQGGTNRADWQRYLDTLFAADRNLYALDQAYTQVAKTLGPPHGKVPIVLMMPYISNKQKDFGAVEPGGPSLDLTEPSSLAKAARWLVQESARRFGEGQFQHLRLWGYYWMREGIGPPDEEIVKAVARVIHEQGFGFCWIPYANAPGSDHWRELGFDFAIMQPNYAFVDYALPGPRDENRLSDIATQCRQRNLGIEIETWNGALSDPEDRRLLTDYLNHGLPSADGYIRALHGYYVQEFVVRDLYSSDLPANNDLYRDLYLFCKGTYAGRDDAVSCGQPCRVFLSGQQPVRTFALTRQQPAALTEAVQIPGAGGTLLVDFPTERRTDEVRLHVRPAKGKPNAVFTAKVAMYDADNEEHLVSYTSIPGFGALEAGPRWVTVRGLVQAGVALGVGITGPAGASLVVDQVRVLPPLQPGVNRPDPTDGLGAAGVLRDSQYAAAATDADRLLIWPGGAGQVTLLLPGDRHMGTLWLHAVKPGGGQWPTTIEVTCGGRTTSVAGPTDDNQWAAYIPVTLPFVLTSEVVLKLRGGRPIALDEAEFEPAVSLARGKTCTVVPPLPQKPYAYPDDGKKLTDGEFAEVFKDGKLAGGLGANRSVIIDLGAATTVERVRVHAWGGGSADTYFPTSTTVWTSADGVQWQPVRQIAPPSDPPEANRNLREWLEAPLNAPGVRHVRIDFVPHGFLLIDEFEVISNGTNIARGRPYRMVTADDDDEGPGRLTDGRMSAGKYYPRRIVRLPGTDPTVTVDLGQPAEISHAAVHACGGGLWGIWYPERVSVQTSLDGTTWTAPVTTTEHPVETTRETTVGLMQVPINARAQFVRWQFKGRGGMMVDEVEVYGP